jgi:hypothetical protein
MFAIATINALLTFPVCLLLTLLLTMNLTRCIISVLGISSDDDEEMSPPDVGENAVALSVIYAAQLIRQQLRAILHANERLQHFRQPRGRRLPNARASDVTDDTERGQV